MANSKKAILRYYVLDKCFRNSGVDYHFDKLLDKVNEELRYQFGSDVQINRRQLYKDILFMESDKGYCAPIERLQDGKKKIIKYSDRNFSIRGSKLNTEETEQLKNAISIFQSFEGRPEFDWIQGLLPLLTDKFDLEASNRRIIAFDTNEEYTGRDRILELFGHILNRNVIHMKYKTFSQEHIEYQKFHPYYLKQYNNRWFLFGKIDHSNQGYITCPLDRIESIYKTAFDYIDVNENWEDYFFDIIGVTKYDAPIQEIVLKFSSERANYVLTKPIHHTQHSRPKILEDGSIEITIKVIPNKELTTLLLSFGEDVQVIKPDHLRDEIIGRLKRAVKRYI
jgi:predicted DNA-binding transcriptional regulator YafY